MWVGLRVDGGRTGMGGMGGVCGWGDRVGWVEGY